MGERQDTNNNTSGSPQTVGGVPVEDLQRGLTELVNQLKASQEAAAEKEKRDRLVQLGIEYWKAQFEFHKHFMTVSLTAIAAFGALLGSLYSDPTTWWLGPAWLRTAVIILTFSFFAMALIGARIASREAGENLRLMNNVKNEKHYLGFVGPYQVHLIDTQLPFVAGLVGMGVFIMGSIDLRGTPTAFGIAFIVLLVFANLYFMRQKTVYPGLFIEDPSNGEGTDDAGAVR